MMKRVWLPEKYMINECWKGAYLVDTVVINNEVYFILDPADNTNFVIEKATDCVGHTYDEETFEPIYLPITPMYVHWIDRYGDRKIHYGTTTLMSLKEEVTNPNTDDGQDHLIVDYYVVGNQKPRWISSDEIIDCEVSH